MFLKLKSTLAWQQVGDEVLLLDLAQNRMLGLGPQAGKAVLTMAQGGWWLAEDPGLAAYLQGLVVAGLFDVATVLPAEERWHRLELVPPPQGEAPIRWQEALSTFAKACAFLPGANPLCDQAPAS